MDCEYCSQEIDSEDEYLSHLKSSHTRDEVSNIDEKKVDNQLGGFKTDSRDISTNQIILGGGIVLFIAFVGLVGYLMFGGGAGSSQYSWVETQPYSSGHYHGEMYVTIDGNELDFSQSKFQVQDGNFHFEAGNGVQWHGHAQRITLQYALATLDIKATQDKLVYNGTTYTTQNYEIRYLVNGQPVNVSDYKLQKGDVIRVQVVEK